MKSKAKLIKYKSNGKHRWRVKAGGNHKILATDGNQAYENKADMRKAFAGVLQAMADELGVTVYWPDESGSGDGVLVGALTEPQRQALVSRLTKNRQVLLVNTKDDEWAQAVNDYLVNGGGAAIIRRYRRMLQ